MALSYSAYAIATLACHFPCVSRWVCDAVLWQQNLVYSQLKCVRDVAHAWYLHIIHCFFHIPYRRWRKPWSSTTEMSWLSRAINLVAFPVIFYRTKCVVLNAALLSPPRKTVILQVIHVAVGLLSLSTLFPHCRHFIYRFDSNVECASEFCHKLHYDIKKLALGPRSKLFEVN